MAVADSETVTSNQFFRVQAPTSLNATIGSTSIKFKINPINIPNKEATYKIEVYDYNSESEKNPTLAEYGNCDTTKDVTIDKDGYVTVDGLTPTTKYGFRLVATVDGNDVQSGYSDVITTLPVFDSVTVGKLEDAKKENSNKVAVEGDYIWMNGASYDTDAYHIYELQPAKAVIASLKEGDVVTMNDDATVVSLVIFGKANETGSETRDFKDTFQNAAVDITNNNFDKALAGTFKALTLRGNSQSGFNVDGVTMKTDEQGSTNPIVLTNNVEVTASTESTESVDYKIEAGATVTINDIQVTTAEDVTLTANVGKNLVVNANETANDLTFVNLQDRDGNNTSATIEFKGASDNSSEQKGTITIKTTGGSVTVSSNKENGVNVSATMKVEVTDGTVDIKDPSLTGNKTVTVSVSDDEEKKIESTVIALAKTKAPAQFSETVLKDYEDQEIKDMFGVEKEDDIKAIRDYINSFGLNGTGAKLTVDKNSDQVKIVLSNGTQNAIIGNLK